MRRIIYAWNYLEWGGAQIHILALIKEVRKEFAVLILLPQGSNAQFIGFLESFGVEYRLFEPPIDTQPATTLARKIERHWRKWKSERAMLRELDHIGIDDAILHVDLAPQQSLLSLIRLCRRTKVFITLHNPLPTVPRWREMIWKFKFRTISSHPNFNIFCSNKDAKRYFSRYVGPKSVPQMRVTYTSVNPPEIEAALAADLNKEAVLEQHGLSGDKLTVLAVGQFIDRKGRWAFLEAASLVLETNPDIQFIWMAPELPGARDTTAIKKMQLNDSFKLILSADVGSNREQILRFFRIANIFALPSLVEGLPIALLEAMALGIPSISTNVNGIPEAIRDGETGILIEAGDSKALAYAIDRLATDADLRTRLSAAGREYVLKHFDERVVAKMVLQCYEASFDHK